VTVRVVDLFEGVNVDETDAERLLESSRPLNFFSEAGY
jgi:hypothetical protein